MKKIARQFAKFFLGINEESMLIERGLEVSMLFGALNLLDYILVFVTALIVGFLQYHGIKEWQIFLILWVGNMVISGAVVFAQKKSGIDMTLMDGLRRVINAAINYNKITGFLLEGLTLIRLIIWNGADQFILFFYGRIRTQKGRVVVFIIASAVQMAVWTWLYSLGYNSFTELIIR